MAATTIGVRSVAAALLFSALALGCGQAVMAVPPELGAGAASYSVSGHQGLLIFNPNIRFGPFSTDQVRRGITVGSGELEPGLTYEHDQARGSSGFDFLDAGLARHV